MTNQKVYICDHCHKFFQNELEKAHPLYAYYNNLLGKKGTMEAWRYLSKLDAMIGAYDVLMTRHKGTVPTICGACGMISDTAHQIIPLEENMLDGFNRVTHPDIDKKWFTEGSLRFFNTCFSSDAQSGFFVTKESTYHSDGSKTEGYTLRRFTEKGVETIGDFLQFDSCDEAAEEAGRQILACAVFWNHMSQPCEDPEKSKGECSEMHIMATERLIKESSESLVKKAFPMQWESFVESHAKSLRWDEDSRDEFFDTLTSYHFEQRQREEQEEGEAA